MTQESSINLFFGDFIDDKSRKELESRKGATIVAYDPSGCGSFPKGMLVFRKPAILGEWIVHAGKITQDVMLVSSDKSRIMYADDFKKVTDALSSAMEARGIRHNTLMLRYSASTEAAMKNLGLLWKYPQILSAGKILRGIPVFVVSAGPSLDKNGHLLSECRERGVVFAMNSSAGAVARHGSEIDLLVTIEGLDTSGLMKNCSHIHCAALCISSHPNNFNVPVKKFLFSAAQSGFVEIINRVAGCGCFHYGASVATAAIALAEQLGSETIVMLGQDLSYTGGRVYAAGTGREHVTVKIENGFITRSDIEEQNARYRASGLKLSEAPRPAIAVPGWYGNTVYTTQDMKIFAGWIEAWGAAHPNIRFVNATEGGMHIDNTEESTLEEVLSTLEPVHFSMDSSLSNLNPPSEVASRRYLQNVDAWVGELRIAALRAAASGAIKRPGLVTTVNSLLGKVPIVSELAAPRLAVIDGSGANAIIKETKNLRALSWACEKYLSLRCY